MKLVIIESPYKGDITRNLRYLRACIRDCINRSESPYASHRMLTDALDDNDPAERQLGIEAGLAWRRTQYIDEYGYRQDVLPVFYTDLGWSDGMRCAQMRYDAEAKSYVERKLGGEWAT